MKELHIYNTLSRKKEKFDPIDEDLVTIYVCGPTVYGEPHLGHAKSYVSFEIISVNLRAYFINKKAGQQELLSLFW